MWYWNVCRRAKKKYTNIIIDGCDISSQSLQIAKITLLPPSVAKSSIKIALWFS